MKNFDATRLTEALGNLPDDPAQLQQACDIVSGHFGLQAKKIGTPETEIVNRFQSGLHKGYSDPNWTPPSVTTSR